MSNRKPKRAKSRSTVQAAAEKEMIGLYGKSIDVVLTKRKLELEGCIVEVDGYGQSADGTIHLVEAWAHIGKAKGSQPKKILTDVLKLAFAADALQLSTQQTQITKCILFADVIAAKVLEGEKWGAAAARLLEVQSVVVELPSTLKSQIIGAQKEQDIRELPAK